MPHGVLILDKPEGVSSARALAPLKRLAGRRSKVGHAGTLDPFATGVLLALVGDATRLSDLAMALAKRYRATVTFGRATDTLDPDGAVVAEADPGAAPPADLDRIAGGFVGEIEQVPPAFSALKVDGRRAYKLARAGEAPALEPRRVTVLELSVARVVWPRVELEIECGAGFYVRSLARDLGLALGLPAHLAALRRTHVGPFDAADGVAPEEVLLDALLPAARLVRAAGLPEREIDREEARRFVAGQAVAVARLPDAALAAVFSDAELVGLGRPEGERLRPEVVFSAARAKLEGR